MASCPECRNQGMLSWQMSPRRQRVCNACAGTFLSKDEAYALLVRDGAWDTEVLGVRFASSTPTGVPCLDCGERLVQVDLELARPKLCPACVGAWLREGDEEHIIRAGNARRPSDTPVAPSPADRVSPSADVATARAPEASDGASKDPHPAPSAAPKPPVSGAVTDARPPPPPRGAVGTAARTSQRPRGMRAVALVAAVLLLGGIGWWALQGAQPVTPKARETPAAMPDTDETASYQTYFNHYRFGGRTVDWWTERLNTLRPSGPGADPRLFDLTKKRARAAGLDIREEDGTLTAVLSPTTTQILLRRLEVRP